MICAIMILVSRIDIHIKQSQLSDKGYKINVATGNAYRLSFDNEPPLMLVEIGDTLIRFNSGIMLPGEPKPAPDGIARHTDTSGSNEYNVKHSDIRAQAAQSWLR